MKALLISFVLSLVFNQGQVVTVNTQEVQIVTDDGNIWSIDNDGNYNIGDTGIIIRDTHNTYDPTDDDILGIIIPE